MVSEKNNSKSFSENHAGLFVILASEGIDWETTMTVYDARMFTEQSFDRKRERTDASGHPIRTL